jgi:hypothetical protein
MREEVNAAIEALSLEFEKIIGMKITDVTVGASDNINEHNGKQALFCEIDLLDLETGNPKKLTIDLGDF